jgi:TetR/AcrR family transcriptional repressor of nem operon
MNKRSEARTRMNDPQAVRARILDAAADLFQDHGYAQTTTDIVRKAAGVSGGALHYHYPTKKDLGLAVIRDRVGPAVAAAWIKPIENSPTAAQGIRSAFMAIARELKQQSKVRGCPLNNLTIELSFADPDFRAELQPIFERWKEALVRRLRQQPDAAVASKQLAEGLATLIIASYSGAMTMAKASQSPEPLSTVLKTLEKSLSI